MSSTKSLRVGGVSLQTFRSAYVQLVDPRHLPFPALSLLGSPDFQASLFQEVFAQPEVPPRYTARVLKHLIDKIEESSSTCKETENAEKEDQEYEEGINEDLLSLYTTLISSPFSPPDPFAKVLVTYSLPSPYENVKIREARGVISGQGTTGLRTWEAACALGEWLLSRSTLCLQDKKVLELGTGTGFVSLLAGRMHAKSVLATDGDAAVCKVLEEAVEENEMGAVVGVEQLWWGNADEPRRAFDVVLAADVTYDTEVIPKLVKTLVGLFERNTGLEVVIAATMRNLDTFEVFVESCRSEGLRLDIEEWKAKEGERVFWYSTEIPVVICQLDRHNRSDYTDTEHGQF